MQKFKKRKPPKFQANSDSFVAFPIGWMRKRSRNCKLQIVKYYLLLFPSFRIFRRTLAYSGCDGQYCGAFISACISSEFVTILGQFPGSAAVHFFEDHSHLGSLFRINTIEVPVRGKVTDFIEGKGEFFGISRTTAS